jgi:hypothetical protein
MHNYQFDPQFRSAVDQQVNSAIYSEQLRAADQASIAAHHHGGIGILFIVFAKAILIAIVIAIVVIPAAFMATIESRSGPHLAAGEYLAPKEEKFVLADVQATPAPRVVLVNPHPDHK